MLKCRTEFDPTRQKAKETDWGRTFGWFVERDGERIGELDYVCWDSRLQFWHDYRVTWRAPEDAVSGPDEWIKAGLTLRNRFYTDVVVTGFMTSNITEGGVISVRGTHVPEERL
ncbi:MAG: hypothetical protein EOP86_24540 [Verrucomicrobiaceae bacterium]|nr:MAG: hypothetical protein EOP86_24540 [Verrucomicrobiaceae bacterium]